MCLVSLHRCATLQSVAILSNLLYKLYCIVSPGCIYQRFSTTSNHKHICTLLRRVSSSQLFIVFLHRQTLPMRTSPLRGKAIRSTIRSAKNSVDPNRTATICKELQREWFSFSSAVCPSHTVATERTEQYFENIIVLIWLQKDKLTFSWCSF